ncbi:uncharacterized protein LOC114397318 [Glycine soja]|uniref:uncharacterized protein LOC114397318 n=1 Tax=Glycine soja TaxID=3848 RepID=UPI0010386E5F|nr:uncharacterized protein LOC114397318 [Glycine soja]
MPDSPHTLASLEDAILKLAARQLSMGETLQTVTFQLTEILHRLPSPAPTTGPTAATPTSSSLPAHQHIIKIDVPRFDGSDPSGWIFKITQYFEYHSTPEAERLTIAAFYMDGRALAWFQWMNGNGQFTSWPAFLQAVQTRFAPSQYEDPIGVLFKLTQKGTVNQYLAEFEELANRIVGLPPPFLLSCFVSGLSLEIRREVQAHQPLTLVQAAGLARLQEEKFLDGRHLSRTRQPPTIHAHPQPQQPHPQPNPTHLGPLSLHQNPNSPMPIRSVPTPPMLPPPPCPTPSPVKRLTPEEIASRREQGLCFTCDEKYHRGHHCASRAFLLVAKEDDPLPALINPPDPQPDPAPPDPSDPYPAQISFNSLAGQVAPEMLRFMGFIGDRQVVLLVDDGSTHNFIQLQLVSELGLSTRDTRPLRVMVGNGQQFECARVCEDVSVVIQSTHFTVDLHMLPIAGANVVLGVQWLKSLGPVLTDYNTLCMKFFHADNLVELKGDTETTLNFISSTQFHRLRRHQPTSLYFHVAILPEPPSIQASPTSLPQIQALLDRYHSLFQPPSALPPQRETDHHIHLLPQATPVNVRPYRYPHFQKQEIEQQVELMLQKGLIRPSNSPFSSPVLLVKKQDGSWRFCVDYRALNALTIKDRFPIPTVDELLDELGGAHYFSKLDLLQGYHQIRMCPEDISKTAFRTHHDHYEFRVMSFGLCNAPSSFQATMNAIFRPYLRRFIIVFFDDILVYSASLTEHLNHLEITFQNRVEYLSHIVSSEGVKPVTSKVEAIMHWPSPHLIKAVRSFLGLAGFYRRFIRGYATIAAPLVHITTKAQFLWTDKAQEAFEKLKLAVSTAPVLSLPDFEQPFTVETDASGVGMGVVLSQQGHPLAFFSKPFPKKLLSASTYVRELFVVTTAVKKWRQYLLGHRFTIVTDHRSLKELLTQLIQTPEQHTYLARLMGYDYHIIHCFGALNQAANALSRLPEHTSSLMMLSVPCLTFMEELRRQLEASPEYVNQRQAINESPTTFPSCISIRAYEIPGIRGPGKPPQPSLRRR